MINFDTINQLAPILPSNSRLPSNPLIHNLAHCDHAIQLLSSTLDIHNHIAFVVIHPEQTHLLTGKLFQSVHCIIVKEVGVILSAACSLKTECILEHLAKWAPYKKINENIGFYLR
jgi:hypothetical protein